MVECWSSMWMRVVLGDHVRWCCELSDLAVWKDLGLFIDSKVHSFSV